MVGVQGGWSSEVEGSLDRKASAALGAMKFEGGRGDVFSGGFREVVRDGEVRVVQLKIVTLGPLWWCVEEGRVEGESAQCWVQDQGQIEEEFSGLREEVASENTRRERR